MIKLDGNMIQSTWYKIVIRHDRICPFDEICLGLIVKKEYSKPKVYFSYSKLNMYKKLFENKVELEKLEFYIKYLFKNKLNTNNEYYIGDILSMFEYDVINGLSLYTVQVYSYFFEDFFIESKNDFDYQKIFKKFIFPNVRLEKLNKILSVEL